MSGGGEQRRKLVAAWADLCDSLKARAEELLEGSRGEITDQQFAEGIRHLGRLAVHGLQSRVEFRDTNFPGFYRVCDDRNRWGAPNADTHYLMAALRGDGIYRISGNCHGRRFAVGRLWSDSPGFVMGDDGTFEIHLSAAAQGGNWIAIPAEMDGAAGVTGYHPGLGGSILVKIFEEDWERDLPAPRMAITRIDEGRPQAPPPLSPELLERRLRDAEALFRESWDFYEEHQAKMRAMIAPNVLAPPVTAIIPVLKPDIAGSPLFYGFGFFDLAPGECWLIESEVPTQGHWGFQLYSRWYESLDFQHRQSSLNRNQACIDDDGKLRIVVGPQEPGTANWLDSEGHRQGCLIYRWLRCETTPTPKAQVVRLDDLHVLLPTSHRRVSPAERRTSLGKRASAMAVRWQS